MQLSLYVIENEAAIAAVRRDVRTTLAVWLSARGHGVRKGNTPASNSHIFGRRGGARVESRVALFGLKSVFFAN